MARILYLSYAFLFLFAALECTETKDAHVLRPAGLRQASPSAKASENRQDEREMSNAQNERMLPQAQNHPTGQNQASAGSSGQTLNKQNNVPPLVLSSSKHSSQAGNTSSSKTEDKEAIFSLDELTAHATRERSDLKAADSAVAALAQDEWVALSGYLPQFQAGALYQTSRNYIAPVKLYQIVGTQTLFDAAGPYLDYKSAVAQKRIAAYERVLVHDQIIREVRGKFLDLWASSITSPLQVARKKSGISNFQKAEKGKRVGTVSEFEFEEARKKFQETLTTVYTYNVDYDDLLRQLETASEKKIDDIRNPAADYLLSETLRRADLIVLEEYLAEAPCNRSIFAVLDQEIELATIALRKAAWSYLPTATLNINIYQTTDRNPLSQTGFYSFPWLFGIEFGWTFDGFANVARVHKAEANRLEKILTKKRTEFTVAQEVKTAYHDFKAGAYALQQQVVTTHEEHQKFLKSKKAYEVGLISQTDYLQAATDWKSKEADLAYAAGDAAQLYEQLLYQTGYPRNRTSIILDATLSKHERIPS